MLQFSDVINIKQVYLIALVATSRMWINKLELNFSDFCEYSCISEINFPKKKHIKISVTSSRFISTINFENRLISYISEGHFSNHLREADQISKSSTYNLWRQSAFAQMTKYLIPHYVLFLRYLPMKLVMPEAGLQLFLKHDKTIRKVPIMESKNGLKKSTEVHFNTSKIFLVFLQRI